MGSGLREEAVTEMDLVPRLHLEHLVVVESQAERWQRISSSSSYLIRREFSCSSITTTRCRVPDEAARL
jgi:hypothetical protein